METLTINIPDKKSAFVKKLLKELGVTITSTSKTDAPTSSIPNDVTAKTIDNAHKGIGLDKPINNINDFINSL
ncbi:hypothetical protein HQ865_14370 [Mucilaginibacter mali]|uniref:Uncharacterized protein n=1 Tax=Mucilaginibacter mali TaxID=2740462 RepID=A0A7D4PVA8_9SPHI|nr:hypothetical protein [Mucilaginibacter mali]QKJ30883.1 hypothetical protein HQ865_14370 [Mucilaginibacter mali]